MNDTYIKQGYYQLPVTFSPPELQQIRAGFLRLIDSPPPGVGIIREDNNPLVVRSVMGWQRMPGILSDFARDERVLAPVREILGDNVGFHQTKWNPKAPNGNGLKWDPHRGDTFWCFLDGVPDPLGLLSVFIALTDQTEENGAVYAWEGSHVVTLEEIRSSMLGLEQRDQGTVLDTAAELSLQIDPAMLEQYDRNFKRVMLTGSAGTIWVLHSGLLHASRENRSSQTRELVANVFRASGNDPLHSRPEHYLCEPAGNLVVG